MQNQSAIPTNSTPCPPQSTAALLPEEILDVVFAQLQFDYSRDADRNSQMERRETLSKISVVAQGWAIPARRLLFRSMRIASWPQLQCEVGEWIGKQVRYLEIDDDFGEFEDGGGASAIFELLKKLPNLQRLALVDIGFPFFSPIHSSSLRSTVFLPQLSDLCIVGHHYPHAVIFDLLATSNHQISRLSVEGFQSAESHQSHSPGQRLDFRGNLRFLSTEEGFYKALTDPDQVVLGGLEGLEGLFVTAGQYSEREVELHRIIGPTLSTLALGAEELARLADFLPLLSRVRRLSIIGWDVDPAPILKHLPPSLTFLHFADDDVIEPSLSHWAANPSLVPAGLKHISIAFISGSGTFKRLPSIDTLGTSCQDSTIEILRQLTPGNFPFKTIAFSISYSDLDRIGLLRQECVRLEVASSFCNSSFVSSYQPDRRGGEILRVAGCASWLREGEY